MSRRSVPASMLAELEEPKLLRLKDRENTYVLDDGGRAFDAVADRLRRHFESDGGSLLETIVLTDDAGHPAWSMVVSSPAAAALSHGEPVDLGTGPIRCWLYRNGAGAVEAIEIRRSREHTRIGKQVPSANWPFLRPEGEKPPVDPLVLGYLRAAAQGASGS